MGDSESVEPLDHPQPQSLRGAWKHAFSPDLDLDAELKEIRSEWEAEWDADEFQDK